MDKLRELNNDEEMVKQLTVSMQNSLTLTAGQKAVAGQSTAGYDNMSQFIDGYFASLKSKYEEKKEPKPNNPE